MNIQRFIYNAIQNTTTTTNVFKVTLKFFKKNIPHTHIHLLTLLLYEILIQNERIMNKK